jgi:hypothetical protein
VTSDDDSAGERRAEWYGVLDRDAYNPGIVEESDRLADAAKAAEWATVVRLVEQAHRLGPNRWRIGGQSWFTPLHQAAWHGAPVEVVDRLVRLGAWTSLREAGGRRAVDIARERGHDHLLDALAASDLSARGQERFHRWDEHLQRLIATRTEGLAPVRVRPIPTEVVALEGLDPLWFAFPGMYGGFSVSTYKGRLFVESWSRVAGGSGQAHVITESGCVLVDEGFV